MSQIIQEKETAIQYIINDTGFEVDSSELKDDEMNDLIYTDGNQTFVLNGNIFQEVSDNPTLVLQEGEDITQYLINDDKGELVITNIQNNEADLTQETDEQNIQYVDSPDILYINEDGVISTQDNFVQYQLTDFMDTNNALPDGDQEETQLIDINSLLQQQNDGTLIELNAADWYQYAMVKDNNLHQYALPALDLNQMTTNSSDSLIDVSTITGKNLLTGQVVTLESYMNKIQKKIKSISKKSLPWKRPKHNLNLFLNKKFNLGLTIGGRRLIGKIVHVGTKEQDIIPYKQEIICDNVEKENEKVINRINEDSILETSKIKNQMDVQTKLLSKKSNQFQQISKTLSGLMNMDTINKHLYQKSIRIKIIDKYCNNLKDTRNVSFISGYMESTILMNQNKELEEEWTFVPDTLKAEFIHSDAKKQSELKYPETASLTIITTHQKNKQFVQVILDDEKTQKCKYCNVVVKNKQNLISHINNVHKQCELCKCVFSELEELIKHKNMHVQLGDLKVCPINNCKSYFKTELSLKKHMATHKLEAFKCLVCPFSGMSEDDLKKHSQTHPNSCNICSEIFVSEINLNIHKKTHLTNRTRALKRNQITKYYSCQICKSTFSRHSNLQRHVDIHTGAEQLYRCAICECSYHYISSLTRHIVQNHVQIKRPNVIPDESERDI